MREGGRSAVAISDYACGCLWG